MERFFHPGAGCYQRNPDLGALGGVVHRLGYGGTGIQIRDGYRYEADPASNSMTVVRFAEHGIRIPLKTGEQGP